MTSLKKQLLLWLSAMMTAVGLLAAAASYVLAKAEANDFLDYQLRQIAYNVGTGGSIKGRPESGETHDDSEEDYVVQVWDAGGKPVRSTRPGFDLPRHAGAGFSAPLMNGERWRTFTLPSSTHTVQVSQSDEVRLEIAADAAMRALIPVAALIPLSWLLIGFGVARLLRPLERVTTEAARRDESARQPLPLEGVPREIAPLVEAVNGLLARLHRALESQRQFVSNAAHELRTPLTALQLQAENLRDAKEDSEARIGELQKGIRRASVLVDQLLKLARYEAAQENPPPQQSVELSALLKSCIADLIPLAEKRQIDLGIVRSDAGSIAGNENDLRILFGNLLNNSIRYTPEGGTVDVAVTASPSDIMVEISDTGPGVPDVLLPRVYERFFRVADSHAEGSGLGLSIAKAIADRHGLQLTLVNRTDRSGLIARITGRLALS